MHEVLLRGRARALLLFGVPQQRLNKLVWLPGHGCQDRKGVKEANIKQKLSQKARTMPAVCGHTLCSRRKMRTNNKISSHGLDCRMYVHKYISTHM